MSKPKMVEGSGKRKRKKKLTSYLGFSGISKKAAKADIRRVGKRHPLHSIRNYF